MEAQNAKWPRKVVKLRFEGSDAVASVEGHLSGKLPGADGKPHPTELQTAVEDTWTRTPQGWRIRRSKMLKMAMRRQSRRIALAGRLKWVVAGGGDGDPGHHAREDRRAEQHREDEELQAVDRHEERRGEQTGHASASVSKGDLQRAQDEHQGEA